MKHFGAIFDWDGVVIDSSNQHEKSWQRLAEEEKRALPNDFFLRSFGMKNENIIPQLLGWSEQAQQIQQLSLRKEQLYREALCSRRIELLPGVGVFLDRLHAAGVPCAIASSTPRANIDCVIDQLAIRLYFRAMVTGEDVKHGKPDPEVFLLAGARLGLSPGDCVVFEDAHVGVQAGLAAGMKVVAVATTHPAESLRNAHRVVQRLDELQITDLEKLLSGQ